MITRFFIVVLVICASCRDWGWPDVHPQPFHAKLWHDFNADQLTFGGPEPRLAMLDDLRDRHLKNGIPRDDVLVLLGQPDFRAQDVTSGQPRLDEYSVGTSGERRA